MPGIAIHVHACSLNRNMCQTQATAVYVPQPYAMRSIDDELRPTFSLRWLVAYTTSISIVRSLCRRLCAQFIEFIFKSKTQEKTRNYRICDLLKIFDENDRIKRYKYTNNCFYDDFQFIEQFSIFFSFRSSFWFIGEKKKNIFSGENEQESLIFWTKIGNKTLMIVNNCVPVAVPVCGQRHQSNFTTLCNSCEIQQQNSVWGAIFLLNSSYTNYTLRRIFPPILHTYLMYKWYCCCLEKTTQNTKRAKLRTSGRARRGKIYASITVIEPRWNENVIFSLLSQRRTQNYLQTYEHEQRNRKDWKTVILSYSLNKLPPEQIKNALYYWTHWR